MINSKKRPIFSFEPAELYLVLFEIREVLAYKMDKFAGQTEKIECRGSKNYANIRLQSLQETP